MAMAISDSSYYYSYDQVIGDGRMRNPGLGVSNPRDQGNAAFTTLLY